MAAAGTAPIMTVAIVTTKNLLWFGVGFGPFEVRKLSQYRFWSMVYAMRPVGSEEAVFECVPTG